ncbi:Histidine--tRNA ligase [Fundidesulfovibrio magnetotacticus]|uniref:Histidine--tRNA ligase n=1 Tax=Fundidesulfovibrio magnetotacticus TaxID=2730080 RepID=A0A6V8LZY4_9BACT|nr:histidine--tRNA ligase [Fundidesulfovibrio magnetotacticus]GFK95346.1 Histidine--tRNA ligase [Fundidesulfovibrio magnetotacticus]
MDKIQKIKGFADLLPADAQVFDRLEDAARRVFGSYGYRQSRLPILERTELFSRSIGEETDVVQKEMYTFQDRKGRSLTMRPEATAGMVRAYLENGLHAQEELTKLYTYGPMFRYERPQKGRMRQFHQLDVEAFGSPSPLLDAEMLFMLADFLGEIGITGLSFELNSLGCPDCRPGYNEALNEYFRGFDAGQLCEDCMRRKLTNPLRVLDCKVPGCKELTRTAPSIADHQCPACKAHFDAVLEVVDAGGLPYTLNPRLVRGLDYYVRTTFEVTSDMIGAQSAVAGGGRYDGLVRNLGGPDLPGVGFACGMERLALLMGAQDAPAPDFHLVAMGAAAVAQGVLLARELRGAGLSGESALAERSMKSQMRQAAKSRARFCLILGEAEAASGQVQVKDMQTGEQRTLARNDVAQALRP